MCFDREALYGMRRLRAPHKERGLFVCVCARALSMYPSRRVSSAKMLCFRYLTFGGHGAGSNVPPSFFRRHLLGWFCLVLLNQVSHGIDLRTLRWSSVASPHDVHDDKWLYRVGRMGFFLQVKGIHPLFLHWGSGSDELIESCATCRRYLECLGWKQYGLE